MMSNPTSVTLTLLLEQAEAAKALFGEEADEESEDAHLIAFTFYQVNYGNFQFLSNLKDAGIAFDSSWDNGDDFDAGTASCRFTSEGECVEKDIYDSALNPDLDKLLTLINKPKELQHFILDHKEKVSVPALDDDQVKYGKLYLARKLIGLAPVPAPT